MKGFQAYFLTTFLAFFPAWVATGIFEAGVLLNLWIQLGKLQQEGWGPVLPLLAVGLLLAVSLFGLGGLVFWAAQRWDHPLIQGAILYSTWLLLAGIVAYLLSAALGGVSMTAVEGVLDQGELRSAEVEFAARLLLPLQLCLLPWVTLAIYGLRKLGLLANTSP